MKAMKALPDMKALTDMKANAKVHKQSICYE
jgi:hypothetical protein